LHIVFPYIGGMPRLALSVIVFLIACSTRAQNLVPNPGFEEYVKCPDARGGVAFSKDYSNFPMVRSWVSAVYNTTPDYYHRCATTALVSLPENTYNGYQEPRNGSACAGMFIMTGFPDQPWKSDYREYIEARLAQPLEAGKHYYLSFFVNLAFHLPETRNQIAVDLIGARFTDTLIYTEYPWSEKGLYLTGKPDIVRQRNTYITDTAGWTKVSGLYTAHGGEQWLTIGYFKDSLAINKILLYTPIPSDPDSIHSGCYMYMDDVCLVAIEEASDTICAEVFPLTTGLNLSAEKYVWNTGDSTENIRVTNAGKYWRISEGDCVHRTDTIVVLDADTNYNSRTIQADAFPVTISSSVPGGAYHWNTGSNTTAIDAQGPGIYWVTAKKYCGFVVDTFHIYCKEDTLRKDTLIYVSSFPVSLYSTLPGERADSMLANSPGRYELFSREGCKSYLQSVHIVHRDEEDCIWVPSAFTPNGDGKNEQIGPVFSCYILPEQYEFSVYNRFGERVFFSEAAGEKWDGSHKGRQQDVGAYYYMLRYSFHSGIVKSILRKGDISLIR
jgi:gliding motility-associated-like protein